MSSSTGSRVRLTGSGHDRALRILACSIVRELEGRGYELRHVVALAGELIDLACESIRTERAVSPET